jgi:outer membrane protein assembly factor BamD (BamD/ComL family)
MLPLSCAHEKRAEINRDVIVEKQGDLDHALAQVQQRIASAMQQSQRHLQAKEFQKALDVYRSLHDKYPQEKSVDDTYVRAIEDVKRLADRAFDSEDHARAGTNYALLLKNYPSFKPFVGTLSFDRASLEARIAECRSCLYRKGLERYRENNISGAIGIWESILSFDPRNEETRKAVATSKVQLRNLRDVK